jgi:MFS family permease
MRPPRLLILLIVAQVLAMAGFANFAVLLPEFIELWSLSNTQAGWIGGIFFAGYVVAVPILVGLTDVVDAKRVYIVGVIFGLIGSFGFSYFADGFWTAMFFRLLAGISLAGTYMPGLQILNARLDQERRDGAMPWYLGTVTIGTGTSFYLTGQLSEMVDWSQIFIVAGLLQTLCLFLVLFGIPYKVPLPGPVISARHPLDFRPVFQNRAALAYILSYAGHAYELFAFRAWGVAFLVFVSASHAIPIGRAELSSYIAAFSIFGMFASLVGARLALRRGRHRIIKSIMGASFLVGGALGFLSGLPFMMVIAIIGVYAGLLMADSAALTAGVVGAVPDDERGATLAMHSVLGFFGGFLGPLVVGLVLDLSGGQESYLGWGFGCLAMAFGSLAGLLTLSRALRKYAN